MESPRWFKTGTLAVAWLAMLVFTFHACTRMVAAGDTWVAMACGRHFINHGVSTVEPFSANSHAPGPTQAEVQAWPGWAQWICGKVGLETVRKWHPTGWIDQNWLTHVIFYRLTTALGSEQQPYFDALVIWKIGIYLLAAACIFAIARLLGVPPLLSAASASFALFVGRSFLDIRPAGFSNLLVPVFILILVLATTRSIWFIWMLVPLAVLWANVHGGYIYLFIMLVPFMGLHLLSIPFKRSLVSIGWRGLLHTAAAYVTALAASVLFNPYHLTNLTHTFEISLSKHAEQWRNVQEWHPAFEWSNGVGTGVPYLVMLVLACSVGVIWIVTRVLTGRSESQEAKPRKKRREQGAAPQPKVDLALWAIAGLTIYMAYRSRRFIPIAAFAACPVISLGIHQIASSILAAAGSRRLRPLATEAIAAAAAEATAVGLAGLLMVLGIGYLALQRWLFLPVSETSDSVEPNVGLIAAGVVLASLALPLSAVFTVASQQPEDGGQPKPGLRSPVRPTVGATVLLLACLVLGFGTWCTLRIKSVYLDPWPLDPVRSSVFMRMTASFLKPFEACQFIRDNHLSGKMMNFWTEGGFVAWGQDPDPNTGKTPLQLFMDGRAQAAYNTRTFDEWSWIWAGGQPVSKAVQRAEAEGRPLAASDFNYPEIGRWVSQRLRSHGVWVVLGPSRELDVYQTTNKLGPGLESNPEWSKVYQDSYQKIYVDINTPQGRRLFEGISTGQTVYPDEFTKDLNLAYHLLAYGAGLDAKSKGLAYAIAAYRLQPCAVPMQMVYYASRFVDLRPEIKAFCEDLLSDFDGHRNAYARLDGFSGRLEASRLAADYLSGVALQQKNRQAADSYSNRATGYRAEHGVLVDASRW
jgi:hypothetical protein